MLFWPGSTVIGPTSKCSRFAPSATSSGAIGGTDVVVSDA
jgi:hypothetical protein